MSMVRSPHSPEVQTTVAELYSARAEEETSLMAVNLFRSAAAYAAQGRPFK